MAQTDDHTIEPLLTSTQPTLETAQVLTNPIIAAQPPSSHPTTTVLSNDSTITAPHLAADPTPSQDSSAEVETAPASVINSITPGTPEPVDPAHPQITLTLLLVSGRRRVLSFEKDATILRAKELIWNTWPQEWKNEQPPSPGFLRLLYSGKIWPDNLKLSDMNLPDSATTPTVVHVSVRPFAPPLDDSLSRGKSRANRRRARRATAVNSNAGAGEGDDGGVNDSDHGNGCCRCIIC